MISETEAKTAFSQKPPTLGGDLDPERPYRLVEVEGFSPREMGLAPLSSGFLRGRYQVPVDLYLPWVPAGGGPVVMRLFLAAWCAPGKHHLDLIRDLGLASLYCRREQVDGLLSHMARDAAKKLADPGVNTKVKSLVLYDQAMLIMDQAMNDNRLGSNVVHARQYVDQLTSFVEASPEAGKGLASMLLLDHTLYTHSVNVCLLCTAFGHFLKLDGQAVRDLGLGSLYHDIGKKRIPEHILKKPGPLDPREWETMRTHPREGVAMLRPQLGFPEEGLLVVGGHHENLDGTGYPYGLKGPEISLGERLARMVDSYDAITSKRCYRQAAPACLGIEIMQKEMTSHLPKDLFKLFIEFLGCLAPGSSTIGRPSPPPRRRRALLNV